MGLRFALSHYLSRGAEALQLLTTAQYKVLALTPQSGDEPADEFDLAMLEEPRRQVLSAASEIAHIAVELGLAREPSAIEHLSWFGS